MKQKKAKWGRSKKTAQKGQKDVASGVEWEARKNDKKISIEEKESRRQCVPEPQKTDPFVYLWL